jgi:Ethanolamine utilization protein EutJ (predicted chaperonin)
MESGGFGDLFGDPDELQRRIAQFAEQMQGQQALAWADNAIKLAVDMTVAAVNRVNVQGNAEAQAEQIRRVIAVVFPEAVTLVREAREGLQEHALRESRHVLIHARPRARRVRRRSLL